jgi:NADPH:quinone reductase-like Zn-dependent oxidoreductase
VLRRVKGALAALGGCAVLDPPSGGTTDSGEIRQNIEDCLVSVPRTVRRKVRSMQERSIRRERFEEPARQGRRAMWRVGPDRAFSLETPSPYGAFQPRRRALHHEAARVHRFGPPEVITIEETATPLPGDDEILVRVAACGVGPWDAWVRAGKSAIEQPLPLTLGSDLSGTVTQLGSGVRGLSLGQPVFGVTNPRFTGAYADFAVASAAMVAPKPPGLDHRAAAGLPVIAATARQMVDDEARVVAGQRVLVHGAGGSVGSLAVQLAMARGATVLGTSPPGATDYVRSLGVERVVDGTAEDFKRDIAPVQAVIDTVGGATQGKLLAALAPGGILVSSVSQPDPATTAKLGVRGVFILVRVTRQALVDIGALAAAGRLTFRLAPTLPLSKARLAHEMLEGIARRPVGKMVLQPE